MRLYGTYTALVYFTPLIGGWLADNFLGQRISVIIGGMIMAAGQFTLADAVPGRLGSLFYVGLGLLTVGNGFFKANISTMVGRTVPRRRSAPGRRLHHILYGHQCRRPPGAAGVLHPSARALRYGWSYGYFAAGCGMLLSVVIQLLFARRMLGETWACGPPRNARSPPPAAATRR